MTIYIDLIFIINFIYDFCILLMCDILLKRNSTIKRVIFSSLFGEFSLLFLFINVSKVIGFTIKLFMAIIMVIIAFRYRNIKYTLYNVIYMFLCGIILGGFLYFMVENFKINLRLGIKYLLLLITSLIFFIIYCKFLIRQKNNYNNRYKVKIEYESNIFNGVGYLDSGNKLISPYGNKPIILIEKSYISYKKLKLFPVYYSALNHNGILYCFKPNKVYINEKEYNKVLIGLSDFSFHIDGCEVLLNARMENI